MGLLRAERFLGAMSQLVRGRLVTRALRVLLPWLELLLRLAGRLDRGLLCGGQGSTDGCDQLMLHMEHIGRVVGLEMMF